jgi:hypothetical protein
MKPKYSGMEVVRWAGKWNSGDHHHLLYENCLPMLFRTRAQARAWIELKYGYIRRRPDLQGAPFKWRVPVAIKVRVKAL